MASQCRTRYRVLDIWRSIAILAVLGFHFRVPGFANGYLGVDIFFVLSGFLIARDFVNNKCWSLKVFLYNRVMRVFPPLLVVLIVVGLLTEKIMLAEDVVAVHKSAIYSMLGISNYYFLATGGYFSSADELKPLLHTWSLSVEIQFYILVAILFALSSNGARQKLLFKFFIPVFVILSVLLEVFAELVSPNVAFFVFPTRFWQFGLGVVSATWVPLFVSERINKINLFLIIFSLLIIFFMQDASIYIKFVLMLLVALSLVDSSQSLKNGISQWISSRAYFIYLAHWPIVSFGHYIGADMIIVVGISLVFSLSVSSFEPVYNRWFREGYGAIPLAFGLVVFSLLFPFLNGSGVQHQVANRIASAKQSHYRCPIQNKRVLGNIKVCDYSGGGQPDIVLLGNSHAQMYGRPFEKYLESNNVKGKMLTVNHCLPSIGFNVSDKCMAVAEQLASQVNENYKNTIFVIAFHWSDWEEFVGGGGDFKIEFMHGFFRFLDMAGISSNDVIVVRPSLYYKEDVPSVVSRYMMQTEVDSVSVWEKVFIEQSSALDLSSWMGLENSIINLLPVLCPNGVYKCVPFDRFGSYLSDNSHLSAYGATIIEESFMKQVNSLVRERR